MGNRRSRGAITTPSQAAGAQLEEINAVAATRTDQTTSGALPFDRVPHRNSRTLAGDVGSTYGGIAAARKLSCGWIARARAQWGKLYPHVHRLRRNVASAGGTARREVRFVITVLMTSAWDGRAHTVHPVWHWSAWC
jgi:hypothetical protein